MFSVTNVLEIVITKVMKFISIEHQGVEDVVIAAIQKLGQSAGTVAIMAAVGLIKQSPTHYQSFHQNCTEDYWLC